MVEKCIVRFMHSITSWFTVPKGCINSLSIFTVIDNILSKIADLTPPI